MPPASEFAIPVSIFLYAYSGFMLFYLIYSLFNVYHLVRYGVYGFGLYLLVTIFAGGTILLVSGSIFLLVDYDWNQSISTSDIIPSTEAPENGLFDGI